MKVKRNKRAKRVLSFYINNFGFREPLQLIGLYDEGGWWRWRAE